MDGLLIDTEVVERDALRSAAAEHGCSVDDAEFATLIGRSAPETRRLLIQLWTSKGEHPQACDEILTAKERYVEARPIGAKHGATLILDWLETFDVKVAVASSTARTKVIRRLQDSGLWRATIDAVVGGDEVANGKPAPDIFLEAARRLGCPPVHCVVVEDSDSGVLAASSAGMTAIMVPDLSVRTAPPPNEVSGLAYRTVASLSEVIHLFDGSTG